MLIVISFKKALTVGVGTVMDAREVMVIITVSVIKIYISL
jgi:hypothetical protein